MAGAGRGGVRRNAPSVPMRGPSSGPHPGLTLGRYRGNQATSAATTMTRRRRNAEEDNRGRQVRRTHPGPHRQPAGSGLPQPPPPTPAPPAEPEPEPVGIRLGRSGVHQPERAAPKSGALAQSPRSVRSAPPLPARARPSWPGSCLRRRFPPGAQRPRPRHQRRPQRTPRVDRGVCKTDPFRVWLIRGMRDAPGRGSLEGHHHRRLRGRRARPGPRAAAAAHLA